MKSYFTHVTDLFDGYKTGDKCYRSPNYGGITTTPMTNSILGVKYNFVDSGGIGQATRLTRLGECCVSRRNSGNQSQHITISHQTRLKPTQEVQPRRAPKKRVEAQSVRP